MVWMLLGLGVSFRSLNLKLGSFVSPGAGLMPFLLGVGLIICSLIVLSRSLLLIKEKETAAAEYLGGCQFEKGDHGCGLPPRILLNP